MLFTNRCYFFSPILTYPKHRQNHCVFGLACSDSSNSSNYSGTHWILWDLMVETIDDESLPFTVFSVLAAGVTGDVPKRSHNTGSTTIRSWRIAGWTQTFQKCPLPESNESSSHYEWDRHLTA